MSLYLWVPDNQLRSDMEDHLKSRRWTDSGLDLFSPAHSLDFSKTNFGHKMNTGIHFAALDDSGNPVPYLLIVRSSVSLTPLRMSNAIGLADAGYRGELIARVDCVEPNRWCYDVEYGRRLFQVCQYNWLPWKTIKFVDSLEELPAAPDNRGAGGFGSTGT